MRSLLRGSNFAPNDSLGLIERSSKLLSVDNYVRIALGIVEAGKRVDGYSMRNALGMDRIGNC